MLDFSKHFATRLRRAATGIAGRTAQADPIPGSTQVPNSAGGYAWAVDNWTRLDRFLVLGSEGGTFYVGERPLTVENALAARACLAEDGLRVVRRVVEVSEAGRAPKNDPALFVLAMAAGVADDATRAAALAALPSVARTGTHLFHWLQYVRAFRGWGRGVRSAVARWYTAKSPNELGYQLLKYPSRDGWAHRDALRLAHPKAPSVAHDLLFRYAVTGWEGVLELEGVAAGALWAHEVLQRVEAVQALRGSPNGQVPSARVPSGRVPSGRVPSGRVPSGRVPSGQMSPEEAARVIEVYKLTREMVPTELLSHAVVWEALLNGMPLTALIRNLGVMTKVGLIAPGSDAARAVVTRLGDRDALRKARVHPLQLLAALKTYAQGRGMKGSGKWSPVAQVVDALDGAFYLAFENAGSTGKRVMLALDVSGSMGASVHGMPYLSCREASAAMALVTAATEPNHRFVAFTTGTYPSFWSKSHGPQLNTGLSHLAISPRQRLDDVVKSITDIPFGGTDCALPMVEAAKHGWEVDVFVVYTDSETWAGNIHPAQALRAYRERTGIPAKLVVVGMASNGFSIADPDDAGMLDVVGFDTATPQVISDFAAG